MKQNVLYIKPDTFICYWFKLWPALRLYIYKLLLKNIFGHHLKKFPELSETIRSCKTQQFFLCVIFVVYKSVKIYPHFRIDTVIHFFLCFVLLLFITELQRSGYGIQRFPGSEKEEAFRNFCVASKWLNNMMRTFFSLT